MKRSTKRLLALVASIPVLVLATAALYKLGMDRLEDSPRSYLSSVEWAIETVTTTGYGGDHHWEHPLMVVYVGLVQFAGVFLVFLIFPLYLLPFLEERFQARIPTSLKPVRDHLVVFQSGDSMSALIDDCESSGIQVVVADDNLDRARLAMEQERTVVTGRLFDGLLQRAHLLDARTLIANGRDHENVAAILEARSIGFEGEILALTTEPGHQAPSLAAGATSVYTPRHVLGAALAERASPRVASAEGDGRTLGQLLNIEHVRVRMDSGLDGQRVGEVRSSFANEVAILGKWSSGELVFPVSDDERLVGGDILIAAGEAHHLEALSERCGESQIRTSESCVLVAGIGEVGGKVAELLKGAGERVISIDEDAALEPDLVCDIHDPSCLELLPLDQARAAVLALDTDASSLFSTVLLRDRRPDLPIIARVNEDENVDRLYQAGADFALSLGQVTSQLLAERLLNEEVVSVGSSLKLISIHGHQLKGRSLAELDLPRATGASVVGYERSGQLMLDAEPELVLEGADEIFLAGDAKAVAKIGRFFSAPEPGST